MFYSFCVWLIECCYVRICDGHWVNRGLLKGPVVPLYGFGALIVIYALQRVSAVSYTHLRPAGGMTPFAGSTA